MIKLSIITRFPIVSSDVKGKKKKKGKKSERSAFIKRLLTRAMQNCSVRQTQRLVSGCASEQQRGKVHRFFFRGDPSSIRPSRCGLHSA